MGGSKFKEHLSKLLSIISAVLREWNLIQSNSKCFCIITVISESRKFSPEHAVTKYSSPNLNAWKDIQILKLAFGNKILNLQKSIRYYQPVSQIKQAVTILSTNLNRRMLLS
jgi:hypothetical protein